MRKIALFTLLSASFGAALAQPQATWLSKEHDFGAFAEDLGSVEARFLLVNTGDEPLSILRARANCGCTVPKFTEGEIAPGDTAVLSVSYLASGRPGKFSKKVYVNTSADPKLQQTLTISGTVVGASQTIRSRFPVDAGNLQLRDSVVAFGEVLYGKIKTVGLMGYNLTTEPLYPVVVGLPDYMKVAIAPEVVPPGEQVNLSFTLESSKLPEWGINTDHFALIPTAGADTVALSSFVIMSEDFSRLTPGQRQRAPKMEYEPARVDLGMIPADNGVREVKFTVTNRGEDPLLIRRVQAVDPAITNVKISSAKIKKGKSATVTLAVDPSKSNSEIINARVSIIANDPDNPVTVARVTAELIR
ncbi:MAG: DUF1573 domain-containing protein [Muribaculaceae bacterium]|nr:DUF1573 domain-containing protein [Muribaculaceae bacterium]